MNINKLLFFSVETVSQTVTLEELSNDKKRVWTSLLDVFEKRITDASDLDKLYPDGNISHDALYSHTAGLYPEFGKVCCVSMAFVTGDGSVKFESFSGDDEKVILNNTKKVLDKVHGIGFSLCGQNVKNFGIPFLGKRFIVNGIEPPKLFPTHDVKPWDLRVIDIKDMWSFGGRFGLSSLGVICSSLDIESSENGEINGNNMNEFFFNGEFDMIKDRCEMNVTSCIEIYKKITV